MDNEIYNRVYERTLDIEHLVRKEPPGVVVNCLSTTGKIVNEYSKTLGMVFDDLYDDEPLPLGQIATHTYPVPNNLLLGNQTVTILNAFTYSEVKNTASDKKNDRTLIKILCEINDNYKQKVICLSYSNLNITMSRAKLIKWININCKNNMFTLID